jgi:hypothetical protein
MRWPGLAAIALAAVIPVAAQTPEEAPPPRHGGPNRWFFGGGFGLSFGTVDAVTVAPMIGYHVIPRVDVGTQLYYRWVNDSRYSPSVTTNDYGATLFMRARVAWQLYLEADYQYTNYQYVTGVGVTSRASYNSFLAGAGYGVPIGGKASLYVSALYDFGYNANDASLPYNSPWRLQVGVMVGF